VVKLGQVVAERVASLASTDRRIWVIDGDLGDSYGVDKLAHGNIGDRFIQAGIAEQTMVAVAGGLAACGLRPWLFSFAAFLCCRAYDQIRICVSQTKLPVVLIGSHVGGCNGANGKSHSILNDIAIMSTLPNIDIWSPADALDAEYAAEQAAAWPTATYIRLPREPQPLLPGEAGPFRWFGTPGPVVMVSTGLGTQWAFDVRSILASLGVEVAVLHLVRCAPVSDLEVINSLSSAERLIVIDDHYECGGLADILRRQFPRQAMSCIAWPRGWMGASGGAEALRAACGIDNRNIVDLCLKELEGAHSELRLRS
jgi:transketolase